MTKITEILSLLENVKQTSSGYTSRCPAHDDNKNSLSLTEGDNGKTIFHCFAGCSYQDIATALNLSTNGKGQSASKHIEAIYDYTDEDGKLLYQNVRFEEKDFRWRRFDKDGKEIWNLDGVRRVPYRLAEILKMPAHYNFVMAEGEKDADTLTANGLIATNHKNWRTEFNYELMLRKVG